MKALVLFLLPLAFVSPMNAESPEEKSFESKFKLKSSFSLQIGKGVNIPTGARFEEENFFYRERLIMMITKWGSDVSFWIDNKTGLEISYGKMTPDGRPQLLVALDEGDQLAAALWRKHKGLLCPVPDADFQAYAKLLMEADEEAETGEIVGEIFEQMQKKLYPGACTQPSVAKAPSGE